MAISPEKRADGVVRHRLTCYLKRSHWRRAKRYREGFATLSAAEERRKALQRIARERGMDGVCDAVWGVALRAAGPGARRGGLAGEVEAYLALKETSGRRERTLQNLRARLRWLVRQLGDGPPGRVTTAELQDLLDAMPGAPRTRINYGIAWRAFFTWWFAREQLPAERNPMAAVQLPSDPRGLPPVATPWQVARLIAAAWRHQGERRRPGPMLGYALLSFFSPVRPEESVRLGWAQINWERGFAVIDETVTKVSRIRHARLLPELLRCLRALKKKKHPPARWSRRAWRAIRRRAGLAAAWAPDLGRHTYASYEYALTHDEVELAADMGNSVEVLRAHYLNKLVSAAEAQRWRRILATVAARLRRRRV